MKPETNFRKILESVSHRYEARQIFDAFVKLGACALAAGTREEEYLAEAKRWDKEELNRFAQAMACLVREMEKHPYEDLLGTFYMDFALSYQGQKWHCEFHTPKPIGDAMARMTFGDGVIPEDKKTLTILEPACGSGALILSAAEAIQPQDRRKLRVTAIDINETACDMCFINTTLWGIPCRVIHGNTLSMEFWHQWDNVHMIMPWLSLVAGVRDGLPPTMPKTIQGAPPRPAVIEMIKRSYVQQDLIPA